jgi:hypothetical protein
VVFNNGKFWNWVTGILSHTGKYGSGQKGFIDLASLPGNLYQLFATEKTFFYITGISLAIGIILTLKYRKRALTQQSDRMVRAILAVPVAIILCIALILKHFEVHYFSSFYVFKFLLISLVYLLVIRLDLNKIIRIIALVFIGVAVIYISYDEIPKMQAWNKHYIERKAMFDEEYLKVMSLVDEESPVILSCRFYGAPFIEYAHYSGFVMSFHLRGSFKPYLKEKFPVSYFYVSWSDQFYYWNEFVDFQQILDKANHSFFIFIGEKKGDDLPVIEKRIWQVLDKNEAAWEVVYQNAKTGARLIKVTIL